MTGEQVIARLRNLSNPDGLAGMERFGITTPTR
jgi:hypothetical protein